MDKHLTGFFSAGLFTFASVSSLKVLEAGCTHLVSGTEPVGLGLMHPCSSVSPASLPFFYMISNFKYPDELRVGVKGLSLDCTSDVWIVCT